MMAVLPPGASRLLARVQPVAAAPGTLLPVGVEVWHLDLNACADLQSEARDLLDDADRRAADRFTRPASRIRQQLTHAALRCLLARHLGTQPGLLRFQVGPHGKPELDPKRDLRFSLSHSGTDALFALAWGREVGVDLERIRPRRSLEQLAMTCFSPVELAAWLAVPAADRLRGFYRFWACKEALIKAWALGLAAGLQRFDVALAPQTAPLLARADVPAAPPGDWIVRELQGPAGYAAALAVQQLGSP